MSNQYKNATNSKIKRIFSSTKGVDCIIIANSNSMDPNFRYLTNFSSGLFEGSFLIVSKGRLKLLTSNLEYDTAVSQAHDAIEVIKITNRDQLIKALSSEISGKSIGLNYAFIPYSIYAFIKKAAKPGRITDAYPALLLARLVKDEKEISYIRKAAAITKKAMAAIEEKFRVGITEEELASEFDGISASYGSSAPSFRTIVCFGQNAALPHHFPSKRRLGEKDEILIDAGATVNGYCSDITRTFIERCRGSPKWERIRTMYDTVKEAQDAAIAKIMTGNALSSPHIAAENVINSAKGGIFKGKFIHSLGHSVGIEGHDGGSLSPNSKGEMEENMVFTAEPGIYIKGFGGVRIEDDILITPKGGVKL